MESCQYKASQEQYEEMQRRLWVDGHNEMFTAYQAEDDWLREKFGLVVDGDVN